MSNPAVLTLENASTHRGKFKRFVIEDNIGESIHLHVNDMRVDFTIKEFLEFSQLIRKSLKELFLLKGYQLECFDEHFLQQCGTLLTDLMDIKVEEITLSKLKCIVYSNYRSDLNLQKLTTLNKTPAYRYLNGDKKDFINYRQYIFFSVNNEKRLIQIMESIKKNGYPRNNNHIILFDNQDYIRDGQHRAAVLAYLHGLDYKVKVLRFYFKGNTHLLHPFRNNTMGVSKWFIKRVLQKLRTSMKK